MIDLNTILSYAGYIFFGVFLLGAFLIIFFVFVKDREQKPKAEKVKKDSLFDQTGRKNKRALVAKSKALSKDEAAAAVFSEKPAGGFSFGATNPSSGPVPQQFAPAAPEPTPGATRRTLPEAPAAENVPNRTLRRFPPQPPR